jgi:stress-induced morphogen
LQNVNLSKSDQFQNQRPVNRQRGVNRVLKDEFATIHALSVSARTPEEHSNNDEKHLTPPCAGKS